jgi:hypothetical protein
MMDRDSLVAAKCLAFNGLKPAALIRPLELRPVQVLRTELSSVKKGELASPPRCAYAATC